MIDYKEELILSLEKNPVYFFPSQEVIDSDERVVLALWKNFFYNDGEDYFDFFKWYEKASWGDKLQKYATDTVLWEKLLDMKFSSSYWGQENTSYSFILTPRFQADFPHIAKYFIEDEKQLIRIFNKTGQDEFFELLKLDLTKKEDIYKSFLLNNSYNIKEETIRKYENDSEFVVKILENKPSLFPMLSEENRQKEEYIKHGVKYYSSFFLLNEENQSKFFKTWSQLHLNGIGAKDIQKLSEKYQINLYTRKQDIFMSALATNQISQGLADKILKTNFQYVIPCYSNKDLALFANKKENLDTIKEKLENFVNNYSSCFLTKIESKFLVLISFFPELQEKLESNIFYQVSKAAKLPLEEKKEVSWFEAKAKQILEKLEKKEVTAEKAEEFLYFAKNALSGGANKKLRLPKENILKVVQATYLHEALTTELSEQNNHQKKLKV